MAVKATGVGGYHPASRAGRRTMELRFEEGHEFHGAEVEVALTAPLEFVLTIEEIDSLPSAEKVALLREFGDSVLVSWNIVDREGVPMAASGASLLAQDMDFAVAVVQAWAEVMTSPGRPFATASNGTGP